MQSYEFYTTVKDGVIVIPKEYKDKIGKKIKVTLVEEENVSVRDKLLPPTLDTRGWKFDKEEANER